MDAVDWVRYKKEHLAFELKHELPSIDSMHFA